MCSLHSEQAHRFFGAHRSNTTSCGCCCEQHESQHLARAYELLAVTLHCSLAAGPTTLAMMTSINQEKSAVSTVCLMVRSCRNLLEPQ